MNADIQTVTIITLVVTEIALTWRIWKLERRLLAVTSHFVDAKNFLGEISRVVDKYHGVVEAVTKNGIDIKLRSEKLGEFELNIKGTEAK